MADVVGVDSDATFRKLYDRQVRFDSEKNIALSFFRNHFSMRENVDGKNLEPLSEVFVESVSPYVPDMYRPLIIMDPDNSKIPISCAVGNSGKVVSVTFPLKVMDDFVVLCESREGIIPHQKSRSLKDVVEQNSSPADSRIWGPFRVGLTRKPKYFKGAYILKYPPSEVSNPALVGPAAKTLRSFENRRGLFSHPLIHERFKDIKSGDQFLTVHDNVLNNNGRPVSFVFIPK